MFTIRSKQELAPDVTRFTIEAPVIARAARAGQFVVVVIDDQGERIPLTLADWDADKGEITIIFQKIGATTRTLGLLEPGDAIAHILGPLGHPTKTENYGTVVCIGGGVGIAEVYPVSRAFKETGNRVIGIIGARTAGLVILQKEMGGACDELFIATDDGSAGTKGLVTDVLTGLLGVIEKSTHTTYPRIVYAIGPVPMMKAVADLTREYGIKTVISVNPIMVDATGMCGACRCTVGGKTVFGCVDGPDFDAHQVDFDILNRRLRSFTDQERMR